MQTNYAHQCIWKAFRMRITATHRHASSMSTYNTGGSEEESWTQRGSPVTTAIIGGGAVGTSLAYHLAKQGERGVCLLEKTSLTAGSTWHAAGLSTFYHPVVNLKKIHYYSQNMYTQLTAETGQEVGFHRPGSIRIATKPETIDEFRFHMSRAGIQSSPQCLLNPDEIAEKVPFIDKDKILMGLYTPYDGHIDPYSLTQAIATGARKFGAKIHQNVEVTSLQLRSDGGWTVGTSKGTFKADKVINASGFWAKEVGKMTGLDLPVVPIHHQYLVTSSVPEIQALKTEFPVLRLLESSCYVRQERDGFLVGVYESQETMQMSDDWVRNGVPVGFGKELFPSDIERLMPHLEQVMDILAPFASANIQSVVNGPITYTPDLLPLVGPSVLPNMWLAVGFGYGIVHAGGIGKFLADWILKGEPSHDLIQCDPGRFASWTKDDYVFAKARESYGMNNALPYPHEERFAGRPTCRVTPAYDLQVERGANMAFGSGWENPSWFAVQPEKPEYKPSFSRTNWHDSVDREWHAVTENAGVIDLSPFAKFILEGPQAPQFLDYITANKIPSLNRCILTHMLTPSGKVYAELTVTRIEENKFLVITGSGSEIHDLRWMKDIARKGLWDVHLHNITNEFGCLSIAGPKAKQVMEKLHPTFKQKFPFFTSRQFELDGIKIIAVRLSYTGELGWELYHPIQHTGRVYKAILEAGEPLGLSDFGSLTMNVLRLEKGFRMWGKEMNHDRNIIEAGLTPFVNLTKNNFIGKESVEKILREEMMPKLVMLKIDQESEFDPEGDESVWVCGKAVGTTTSGCFSVALGSPLAFAYLPPFLAVPDAKVQVEIMNHKYTAEVLSRPPDLTHNEKMAEAKKAKADILSLAKSNARMM